MSFIDIIIPIKGRPEMLAKRSLPSLLNQNYKDFTVTVVDDGSTDDEHQALRQTIEIFTGNGLSIQIIKNEGKPGAAGARNYGFKQTSHPYVLWFDSDDILLENKLVSSLCLIESNNFDLAITRAQHIRDGELINEFWGEPIAPNRGTFKFHFPFQTMCALYRRSFLLESGLRWNSENNLNDDWEFSNEVILTTENWIYSPLVTAHYFVPNETSKSIGSMSTSRTVKSQLQAFARIIELTKNKPMKITFAYKLRLFRQLLKLIKEQPNQTTLLEAFRILYKLQQV